MTNVFSNVATMQKPTAPQQKPADKQPSAALPTKNDASASMSLGKPQIGVIDPAQDLYRVNLTKEANDRYERMKENMHGESPKKENSKENKPIGASTLSASGLAAEGKKKLGFWGNLFVLALVATGGYFGYRKIKGSIVSTVGISTLDGIKKHLEELTKSATKGKLISKDLKKITVRTINEDPGKIRDTLSTINKLSREARNVDNLAPVMDIRLGQNSGEAAKTIKEAFKNEGEGIAKLTDDILQKIDYIKLRYNIKANGNNTHLETIVSELKTGSIAEVTDPGKLVKFLRNLFS